MSGLKAEVFRVSQRSSFKGDVDWLREPCQALCVHIPACLRVQALALTFTSDVSRSSAVLCPFCEEKEEEGAGERSVMAERTQLDTLQCWSMVWAHKQSKGWCPPYMASWATEGVSD